jgi:ribonucleoside-diphosphate reductase alpha chain
MMFQPEGNKLSPARRVPNPSKRNGYGPPPNDLKRSQDPSRWECGKVRKRNGEFEEMSIAKIERKLRRLSAGLHVNFVELATQVSENVYDGIPTSEIDRLAASAAHEKITDHPDYDILAARIAVDNHQKETMAPFSMVMKALHEAGQLRDDFMEVVRENADQLDEAIDYERDNLFTYFGFRTFEHGYGLCIREKDEITGKEISRVYERPQHMWMRVALAFHLDDIDAAIESYNWMSCMYFTHATPTLMNAGKRRQQMSSCFLVAMKEEDHDKDEIMDSVAKSVQSNDYTSAVDRPDSIPKIFETVMDCAKISASTGGIGTHCSMVRAEGSPITSAGRPGSGIIPMLRNFEAMANYVDQGRKRKGAVACFSKDTEVLTINGGVKPIQAVQLGDLVVTHEGRVKPVSQVHVNPLGDRKIYKVVVERSKEIYVTSNHRFWSFTTKKYKDQGTLPGWNSVEELKKLLDNPPTQRHACYMSIPTGTGIQPTSAHVLDMLDYRHLLEDESHTLRLEEDGKKVSRLTHYDENRFNSSNIVQRFWTFTEDVVNMFGIWLGDGHVKMDNVKGIVRGIGFTVDKRNTAEIAFITSTCSDLFGCSVTSHETKHNGCVNIAVNSTLVGTIVQELFGKFFDGKKLPDMAFSWPKTLVHNLIAGLITSDGHIAKRKLNATLGMSNKFLMNQLYHLCRANGVAVSLIEGTRGKGMTCDPFSMSIPLSEEILCQVRKRYDDDRIERCHQRLKGGCNAPKQFLKVLDIVETERRDECVYTLGVDDDHSYAVEGLVAENCYLEPWHADIEDFLIIKENTTESKEWKETGKKRMRDLHVALWIPDIFMQRVDDDGDWSLMCPFYSPDLQDLYGEAFTKRYEEYEAMGAPYVRRVIKARDLWTKIVDAQIHTGEPYMCYKDAVNRKTNHQNLGTVKSSNLCVAPYTKVLTRSGYTEIKDLKDQPVEIWNGFEWSQVTVRQTGSEKSLVRVTLNNGSVLDCTPEHRFYVNDAYYSKTHREALEDENVTKIITASNLSTGDKLIKHQLPDAIQVQHSGDPFKYAYTHGFFCGDGCDPTPEENVQCSFQAKEDGYCERHSHFRGLAILTPDGFETDGRCQAHNGAQAHIRLYGEKKGLLSELDAYNTYEDGGDRIMVCLYPDIEKKFVVPHNGCLEDKMRWLEGLFDADGTIARNGKNESLQLGSVHVEFLRSVMLMLQTMSIPSKVTMNKDAMLPDGKGGQKLYDCKPIYRLLINSGATIKLRGLGFNPKRLEFRYPDHTPNRDATRFVKVESVEPIIGVHDTYCFTEHNLGLGTFEGIVTGQCSEIVQYSSSEKTAVCNLASISLKSFVDENEETGEKTFDHETLAYVVKMITRNLDRIIDINYYPTKEARASNMSERPMGIGVQGLADTFIRMGYPYDSEEAAQLNREIFETIYYAAMESSCEIATEMREPYPSFKGSPVSQGRFQFDMWREEDHEVELSGRWDWDSLRARVKKHGVRNSLLIALMPTASTSQLLGNNESFEPYTNNMYIRTVISGSYKVVNRQMILDLIGMGLWTDEMKNKIIALGGDIQHLEEIPRHVRDLYKTSYGLKQRVIVDQAADRAPFVDQSMSLNIHMAHPTYAAVTSMHMYGWRRGLKTGMYYLRSKPAKEAVAVTVDPTLEKEAQFQRQRSLAGVVTAQKAEEEVDGEVVLEIEQQEDQQPAENYEGWVCRMEEGCLSCGS